MRNGIIGVLTIVAWASGAHGQPTFTLQPVSSTGPFVVDGSEIRIPRGGVEVKLEIVVAGWTVEVDSFSATIDSQGYRGEAAVPPNPGVDLKPRSYPPPNPSCHGACCGASIFTKACRGGVRANLECETNAECPGSVCEVDNPRFLLAGCNAWTGIACVSLNYEFGGVSTVPLCGTEDVGQSAYLGTLTLEIPQEAKGRYTIGLVDDINRTFLGPCGTFCLHLFPYELVGATITIEGACCLAGGECALLNGPDCEAAGGMPTDQVDCAFDSDGDGVAICADECPDDPFKAEPGDCGCGMPDDDADGDGVADCLDECPGVDDAIFAPGCVGAIPAASTWGLVILALLLMGAGKVGFEGRARVEKARQ